MAGFLIEFLMWLEIYSMMLSKVYVYFCFIPIQNLLFTTDSNITLREQTATTQTISSNSMLHDSSVSIGEDI